MADNIARGTKNREWGGKAEQIAAEYLISEGYVIRERNWRIGNHIEIDIIAEKDGYIAFVEVKARRGNVVTADEAVDEKKIKKMVTGGNAYLRTLPHLFKYRLDVITVTGDPENYSVRHLPDAFLPPLSSR